MYSRDRHRQFSSISHRKLRSRSKMSVLKTVLHILVNTASSITIILLNKWIYSHKIFPNISLTALHFIVTFFSLYFCEKLNFFNIKSANLHQLVTLSLCFCGFVVLTNLSLEHNSVGTFQIAKTMTTPGVMIIQSFRGKQFSSKVKLTTVPIIVGVVLCFMYDIRLNVLGTVFAVSGVTITSFYQVLVNSKQAELQLNSMQLLFYQAPLSAFLLSLCVPLVEPQIVTTFMHHWTLTEVCFIIISCTTAVLVNLTTYWILGNTSPLTYNMVGHSKFVLIMIGGWYLYDNEMSQNQWLGICFTLCGVILYTHVMMKENEAKISAPTEICSEKS